MLWVSLLLSINTKVDLFIVAVAGLYNIQSCFIQYQKMLYIRYLLQPAFTSVVCRKSKCTDFLFNVYWTHLKLQGISFKVCPLGSYTVVPTFFPLIIAVLEVIFHEYVEYV